MAGESRQSKRRRVDSDSAPAGYRLTAAHPYGARPGGDGLGVLGCRANMGAFRALPDSLLLDILGLLPPESLGRLACVSRAFYVLAHDSELWRTIAVDLANVSGKTPAGLQLNAGQSEPLSALRTTLPFRFRGTWKDTAVALFEMCRGRSAPPRHAPLRVSDFYSDTIFSAWMCSSLVVPPEWTAIENVDRRSELSLAAFQEEYEVPNRPVVITDVVKEWPAFSSWNLDYLLAASQGASFEAGPVSLPLDAYWEYAKDSTDESPLYVFDPKFGEKVPQLSQDYETPVYFSEDLFSVLGPRRPNYRWLIIGAAQSGSTFHVDPNGTSAWNATITGAKKWIMLPPDCPPPGVHPNEDGSEVTAPVSLAEWFINFYPALQDLPNPPIEFISRAGDLVFVPSGWWHCVLNLDDAAAPGAPVVAITQNYVSSANLPTVCQFLRDRREQVSGCPEETAGSLYELFVGELKTQRPDLMSRTNAPTRVERPPTLWESLRGDGEASQPFTFSF